MVTKIVKGVRVVSKQNRVKLIVTTMEQHLKAALAKL